MHILQISPRLPYPLTSGGAIGIFYITRELARLGHDVTLMTAEPPPHALDEAQKEFAAMNVRLEFIPHHVPSLAVLALKTLFQLNVPLTLGKHRSKKLIERATALHHKHPFDLIHADHTHAGYFYGVELKKRFGIPLVVREHNFETTIYERYASDQKNLATKIFVSMHARRLHRVEIDLIKNYADAVLAITEEDRKRICRELPPSLHKKIYVVPAGVDLDYFLFNEKRNPSSRDIVWVGGFDWRPNADGMEWFLEKIFPHILRREPKATLTLIGNAPTKKLQELATHNPAIRILGRVPDIRPIVSEASCAVIPLRVGGGMRIKMLDFFAMGCPVVASSVGAEGNSARAGEDYMIANSTEEFVETILKIFSDSDGPEQMRKRARFFVEREYDWKMVIQKINTIYGKYV